MLKKIEKNQYKGERLPVEATLMSYNNQLPIYKIGNKICSNFV